MQVIHENLGIAHGCITTVHNVTGTQPIVDMAMTKKKVCVCVMPVISLESLETTASFEDNSVLKNENRTCFKFMVSQLIHSFGGSGHAMSVHVYTPWLLGKAGELKSKQKIITISPRQINDYRGKWLGHIVCFSLLCPCDCACRFRTRTNCQRDVGRVAKVAADTQKPLYGARQTLCLAC